MAQVAAPPAVAAMMDAASYAKSVDYTQAKLSFGMITEVFDTLMLALVVFSGVLPWLYARFTPLAPARGAGCRSPAGAGS